MKELNMVKEALVTSYKMIDLLESKIKSMTQETATLPWENKTEEIIPLSSYNTPQPTPAIENLAKGMIHQMVVKTFNTSKAACKRIFNENEKVVIWKNGVVTTIAESNNTQNPLAVFRSRACARIALRKAGFYVPYSIGTANLDKGETAGGSYKTYIIAYKKD